MAGARRRRRESFADGRARRSQIDDPAIVLDAALRFLEARQRSVAEVRRRLTQAGYRADLLEVAIARLGELGMIDDETFARSWVESRDRARPRGELALRRELALKGIDRAIVDRVLDGRGDEAAAARLLARHAAALARIADAGARRQRAYSLLARNGFSSEIAADAARRLAEGSDEP